jgi:hypothetical protein
MYSIKLPSEETIQTRRLHSSAPAKHDDQQPPWNSACNENAQNMLSTAVMRLTFVWRYQVQFPAATFAILLPACFSSVPPGECCYIRYE